MIASAPVLLALTAGQKTGLLIVAGAFIAFALVSSFVIPRFRPDYPGRRGLPVFVVVSAVFLVGMLTAMVLLATESEEEGEQGGGEGAPALVQRT